MSIAQFYYFSQQSERNAYYKLACNIDMGDNLLSPVASFSGVFDGNNYFISGLRLSAADADYNALFASSTGTIKNLNLSGTITGGKNCAGFVGQQTGGLIENCANYCVISNPASSGTASGIAAAVKSKGEIRQCRNFGEITGDSAAGICSRVSYKLSSKATQNADAIPSITRCQNAAKVTGSYSAAGICVTQDGTTISCCFNSGNITAQNGYASGIVGNARTLNCASSGKVNGTTTTNYSSQSSHLHDCFNTGSVTGKTEAAGIARSFTYHAANRNGHQCYTMNYSLERCYNVGALSVTGASGSCCHIRGNSGSSGDDRGCDPVNCYYPVGKGTPGESGTALSARDMLTVGGFAGFDFLSVWTWDQTGSCDNPILRNNPPAGEEERHIWAQGTLKQPGFDTNGTYSRPCIACSEIQKETLPKLLNSNTVSLDYSEEDQTLSISGKLNVRRDYTLMIAAYDEAGRLLRAELIPYLSQNGGVQELMRSMACPEKPASVGLFAVNADRQPICLALTKLVRQAVS